MNVSLESGFIPSVSDEDILRTSSDDSNRRRSSSDDGIDSSSPTDSEVSVAQLVSSPENNAKEAGNNSYIQLETLAGLSSTSRCFDQTASDDQSSRSGRNSLVSSLSSPSLDGSSANDGGKAAEESPEGGSNVEEFISSYKQQIPDLNKDQINDVFYELFSSSGALESNEKVRTKSTLPHKYNKFKDKTRLVQTVPFHSGAVWTMKFSPSGSYLCTAGQDTNVVIWCIGNPEFVAPLSASDSQDHIASADRERKNHEKGTGTRDFIYPEPYRILQGHTGDVVDVSWSKSHFILSASTDKTVCLWHVSRADCLQYFRHPDIITSVEFHPAHDRYYISGCFDRKIRVWDIIPDGVVLEWTQTTDTVRISGLYYLSAAIS
jgi:WD40 repeat protein